MFLSASSPFPIPSEFVLLLLGSVEWGTNQVGCSPQLNTDDTFNLCEQLLVGYSSSRFDIRDLRVSVCPIQRYTSDMVARQSGVDLHRLVWH